MQYLTNENVAAFLNTGSEVNAQNITGMLEDLFLGVGPTAYLEKKDAHKLFNHDSETRTNLYKAGKNPLYVHLTKEGLALLLKEHAFVITEDEE